MGWTGWGQTNSFQGRKGCWQVTCKDYSSEVMTTVLMFLSSSESQKEKSQCQVFHAGVRASILLLPTLEKLNVWFFPLVGLRHESKGRQRMGSLRKGPSSVWGQILQIPFAILKISMLTPVTVFSFNWHHQKCGHQGGCFVCLLLFAGLFTSCFQVVKFLVRYFPKVLVSLKTIKRCLSIC